MISRLGGVGGGGGLCDNCEVYGFFIPLHCVQNLRFGECFWLCNYN